MILVAFDRAKVVRARFGVAFPLGATHGCRGAPRRASTNREPPTRGRHAILFAGMSLHKKNSFWRRGRFFSSSGCRRETREELQDLYDHFD
jgi:hypothetical protein